VRGRTHLWESHEFTHGETYARFRLVEMIPSCAPVRNKKDHLTFWSVVDIRALPLVVLKLSTCSTVLQRSKLLDGGPQRWNGEGMRFLISWTSSYNQRPLSIDWWREAFESGRDFDHRLWRLPTVVRGMVPPRQWCKSWSDITTLVKWWGGTTLTSWYGSS
jgi:hypothetical protein